MNPNERGNQIFIEITSPYIVPNSLQNEMYCKGILCDFIGKIIKISPFPFYNTFEEIWKCVEGIQRRILQPNLTNEEIVSKLLNKHEISILTGFLPQPDPLQTLPAYFQPWVNLCQIISKNKSSLQVSVMKLPLLDHTKLQSTVSYNP